jgi:hypothetical protein
LADPNAVCPPSQAQVNAGLIGCNYAVADASALPNPIGLDTVVLVYASTLATPPNQPQLSINPANAPGSPAPTVAVGDTGCTTPVTAASHCWYGSAELSQASLAAVLAPGPTMVASINGAAVNPAGLTFSQPIYCDNVLGPCIGKASELIGPHIGGNITAAAALPPGLIPVEVDQANTTPFPGTLPPTFPSLTGGVANVAAATTLNTAPSVAAVPNHGYAGQTTNLSGHLWSAGSVHCAFTTGAPSPDFVDLTPNASGDISGVLTVTTAEALGSNPIVCTQGTNVASAPFTVDQAPPNQCTITGTMCSVTQTISATVSGTNLTIFEQTTGAGAVLPGPPPVFSDNQSDTLTSCPGNPNNLSVTLTGVTLGNGTGTNNQQFQAALGCLNRVQVSDDRGTLPGWTVNAQMNTDFINQTPSGNNGADCSGLTDPAPRAPWMNYANSTTPLVGFPGTLNWPTGNDPTLTASPRTFNSGPEANNGDNCIPAENLIWSPRVSTTTPSSCSTLDGVTVCGPSNLSNEVFAGPTDVLTTHGATNLCYAPGGGGGGGTNCDAWLDLEVPPYVAAGPYVSVMTITVQ